MKKTLTGVVAGWTLLCGGLVPSVAQSLETPLKIEVHLYNYSGVSAEVLARAEQETARIYRRLGVEMEWRHCLRTADELEKKTTCDLPTTSTKFTLRLLSKEMAQRFPVHDDIYGFALLSINGGFGVVANVFADRARETATEEETRGVILGHLIAHELGHLLLGEAGHPAGAGIMHTPWQMKELDQIKRGVMYFLPGQTERIRSQVRARAAGERATEEAPAPRTASSVTGLNIEIHVYNYSAASGDLLGRAEQEAFRIFRRTGVATAWLSCPLTSEEAVRNKACALPDAPTRLTLRLLSNSMADSLGFGGDIFGSALLPDNEEFGVVANVYADRTRELADRREFEVILGRVIAHELGHLLLGKNAHSAAGIMHARWDAQDLGLSRQAAMLFLPGETKRIRAHVRARAVSSHELF